MQDEITIQIQGYLKILTKQLIIFDFQLINFMERLTGPSIGLYCHKVAPYDINTFVQVNNSKRMIISIIRLIYSSLGSHLFHFHIYSFNPLDKRAIDWVIIIDIKFINMKIIKY